MEYLEKVAYLRGLMEGLSLDPASKEGKLFAAVADTLASMAAAIERLEDENEAFSNALEDLTDEVGELGDEVIEMQDSFDELEDLIDTLADDSGEDEDDEDTLYEIKCPSCEHEIVLNEDMLDEGEMACPACGEELEFDISCGCDGCGGEE
jgi:chromosome segregation ATPase